MYTNDVRKLIAQRVPWIKGEMLNYLTFKRLRNEGLLVPLSEAKRGPEAFDGDAVEALIKRFPTFDPPRRPGLIGWLQGKRPKNWPKEARKAAKGRRG